MAQAGTRTVAIHQVTEGGRPLREVRHPLAPELLVAEMAGELPPDVARAVREHIEICPSCGDRSRALASSYDALSSLRDQPVSYVPDLRRSVRLRLEATPAHVRAWHVARQFGGGTLAALCAILALVLVVGLGIATNFVHAPAVLGRSQNGITAPPAAGSSAVVYAQTAKLVDVRDTAGRSWPAAEVVAVDERTGRVLRSLPVGGANLRAANAAQSPVALALAGDGATVYELTAAQRDAQALVAVDSVSGAVRWITTLSMPDGHHLAAGLRANALVVAPDGQTIYVGLDGDPRALAVDATIGRITAALAPQMPAGPRGVLAAGGALAVSPDGRWLFDVTVYANADGTQTAVVRRFSATTGATAQTLALRGDFRLSALAASPSATSPLLYLASAGAAGQVYILSLGASGLSLMGQVPLGGPSVAANTTLNGQIHVSSTADGMQAYVSADVAPGDASVASHDIWLVDSATTAVVTHRVPFLGAGTVLSNWAGGSGGQLFDLVDGQVYLLPPTLSATGDPTPWLRIADGQPVVALLGTTPAS